jgi:hypothetical protein
LHVGSPKTGTTFLQNVLWSQRERTAEQGLLLPMERFADHYLASLDVRGLSGRKEHPQRAVGMWRRMVQEAEAWPGTTLISHELLAAATAEQAASAVAAFGPDTEVHVVLTARDLIRQIPAEWQEHVKHRSRKTLPAFVDELRSDTEGTSWFWRVQDFPEVLARWGAGLPRSRVHVVTVPPAGGDPGSLWERFAGLLGLDPGSFETRQSRANTSLGVEQAELLRRVNAELGDRLPLPGPYPVVVKNVLAHRLLASRPGTRLALDADATAFAVQRSAEIARRIEAMGIDVVGDLDDLVPDPRIAQTAATGSAYERPSDQVLLDESIAALIGLMQTMARDRAELRRHEDRAQTPIRSALVRMSERRPLLMKLRRVYHRRSRLLDRVRPSRQR